METRLLSVENLETSFMTRAGEVRAVRGVSFHVSRGESLGVVGESGCGKSVSMLSVLRLLDDAAEIKNGRVMWKDRDLRTLSERSLEKVRGKEIAMIFQDPMTSLNPVLTIGDQLTEHLIKHTRIGKAKAYARATEMLYRVGIPNPTDRLRQHPVEFSGGMRQRVGIAIALITSPQLIIADEPTTALDVTIQAQILGILKSVRDESGTGIILITHDLGIVADVCDRVNVMYGGLIVETGSVRDIYHRPAHPYTKGLLASVPNPKAEGRERLVPIPGQPPDLFQPPPGCPFAPRCPHTMRICLEQMPPVFRPGDGHAVSCWLHHRHAKSQAAGGAT
jgi:oligopeptide transport system ATP-binding protein